MQIQYYYIYFQAQNQITTIDIDIDTGDLKSNASEGNHNAEMNASNAILAPKRKRTTAKDTTDLRVDRALDLIEARQNKINDDEGGTFGNWVGQALRNTKNPFIKFWMQEEITKIIHEGKRKSLNESIRVTSAISTASNLSPISANDDSSLMHAQDTNCNYDDPASEYFDLTQLNPVYHNVNAK